MSLDNLSKLTFKQQIFCIEFVKDFNATQAAIRAGYSPRTARQMGAENLSKPAIQSKIQEFREKIIQGSVADLQEIMAFLSLIMRGDITKILWWDGKSMRVRWSSENIPRHVARLIKKISITHRKSANGELTEKRINVELHDPVRASAVLANIYGMMKTKRENVCNFVVLPSAGGRCEDDRAIRSMGLIE